VSAKVLTRQLRELEEDRLVTRSGSHQTTRFRGYELTEVGRRLAILLNDFKEWGEFYHQAVPHAANRHGLAHLLHRTVSTESPAQDATPAP